MDLQIPEKFYNNRSTIKKQYKKNETFRDIYDDYLICLKAQRYWQKSSSDEATSRRNEYVELVSALEDELTQIIKNEKL